MSNKTTTVDDLACQGQNGKFAAQLMMDFGVKIHQDHDKLYRLEMHHRG